MKKARQITNAIFQSMELCRKFGQPLTKEVVERVVSVELLPIDTKCVFHAVSSEWRSTKEITSMIIGQKTKNVTVMLSDLEDRGLVVSKFVNPKRKYWKYS